ncbi:lipase family protein [Erwinia sp. HR93]|uniref:lipase family protein n=1 Tax=Erwinia sp. HR93 TaxID=3094840 RepID=UPI002ADEC810|nr:hypothetical protein [Erwinia sp. HR93]MEA1063462.1 hypothetical protein [Erwinia sp. HR93]
MKKDYTFDAECFALASIAWAGAHQEEYNPALTQQKLQAGLNASLITQGKLDNVVWGPAVFRTPKLRNAADNWDDYMFFVVQNRNDPSDYRVAARSTVSSLNGYEDVAVLLPVDWREFDADAPEGAKIADGMAQVLGALLTMTSSVEPGLGTTLVEFLNANLKDGDTLTFCGHSMGGTFTVPWGACVKTLLKQDIRVQVRSLAGATAGNAAFAARAEALLGDGLKRITNFRDLVPKLWNTDSVKEIATLYEPVIILADPIKIIVKLFADVMGVLYGYTHAGQAECFDPGVNPALDKLKDQYGYQHDTAYMNYYDLEFGEGKDIYYDVS